jgi:cephalosporin hydroxylase
MTFLEIPGWYDWEITYQELVTRTDSGLIVEVGSYLGLSLCSLGQMIKNSGKPLHAIGVDTCRGTGIENGYDHHAAAVKDGGGTFAGTLHRNVIECGLSRYVSLIVADSRTAAGFFADESLAAVCLDAQHDYENVKADIAFWLPKVRKGGVLMGDDMGIEGQESVWPGVRQAVTELLPGFEYKPHDVWWYKKVDNSVGGATFKVGNHIHGV